MDPLIVFFTQFAFGFVLMGLATRWYLMPRLRAIPQSRALAIVLFGGAIRYMGTIMLVSGVVPGLSEEFTLPGAVGDVLSALLAIAAIAANHSDSPAGRPLAWVYVVVGGLDLVGTAVQGFRYGLWPHLAGAWTFVVLVFPAVVLALIVTTVLLVRPNRGVGALKPAAA